MQHNDNRDYPYSRGNLLGNGLLVDVTEIARKQGIEYPVAMTAGLAQKLQPNQFLSTFGIKFNDRIKNVLNILKGYFIPQRGGYEDLPGEKVAFPFIILDGPLIEENLITIQALIHEGDTGEPVITLTSLKEDSAA